MREATGSGKLPVGHLRCLLTDLRRSRDLAGTTLLALLTLGSLMTLLTASTTIGTQFALARTHARGDYPSWVLFQALPRMYCYRNRVWTYPGVRPAGAPIESVEHGGPRPAFRYINHHAYRSLLNPADAVLPRSGCVTTILVSDYREVALRTEYVTCREGPTAFSVRRHE